MLDEVFPRVLVVEDDPAIRRSLVINLEAEGYTVVPAASAAEALRAAAIRTPRLAIVDLMLPDLHGLELSRRLKATIDLPIIVLTAITTESVIVEALDQVADDYVVKPFSMVELMARARRVIRRSQGALPPQQISTPAGEIVLNPLGRQVTVNGQPVHLTPTELRLLTYFAANANHVLSTQQLLSYIWPNGDGDENRLWVYIRRLRQAIEPRPSQPVVLTTVRAIGYLLKTTAVPAPSGTTERPTPLR